MTDIDCYDDLETQMDFCFLTPFKMRIETRKKRQRAYDNKTTNKTAQPTVLRVNFW